MKAIVLDHSTWHLHSHDCTQSESVIQSDQDFCRAPTYIMHVSTLFILNNVCVRSQVARDRNKWQSALLRKDFINKEIFFCNLWIWKHLNENWLTSAKLYVPCQCSPWADLWLLFIYLFQCVFLGTGLFSNRFRTPLSRSVCSSYQPHLNAKKISFNFILMEETFHSFFTNFTTS